MNVLVIDGQGGGLGRQLVAALSAQCPDIRLVAVGTNSVAAQAMHKAGAQRAATGENAVVVNCRSADIIVGPIGIVIADALLGGDYPRHGHGSVPEQRHSGADPGEPLRKLYRRRARPAHRQPCSCRRAEGESPLHWGRLLKGAVFADLVHRAGKTIQNGRRVRSGHIQRKNILYFGGQESLRTFLSPFSQEGS